MTGKNKPDTDGRVQLRTSTDLVGVIFSGVGVGTKNVVGKVIQIKIWCKKPSVTRVFQNRLILYVNEANNCGVRYWPVVELDTGQ